MCISIRGYDFNTSNVTIQLAPQYSVFTVTSYFNTSNVTIQQPQCLRTNLHKNNFNTSNVTIQPH